VTDLEAAVKSSPFLSIWIPSGSFAGAKQWAGLDSNIEGKTKQIKQLLTSVKATTSSVTLSNGSDSLMKSGRFLQNGEIRTGTWVDSHLAIANQLQHIFSLILSIRRLNRDNLAWGISGVVWDFNAHRKPMR